MTTEDYRKKIATGSLFFNGSDNKEILEKCIVETMLQKIRKQLITFCKKLPENEFYHLSWNIEHTNKIF